MALRTASTADLRDMMGPESRTLSLGAMNTAILRDMPNLRIIVALRDMVAPEDTMVLRNITVVSARTPSLRWPPGCRKLLRDQPDLPGPRACFIGPSKDLFHDTGKGKRIFLYTL